MILPAGTRLGPYAIRAVLGTGGMGEVYRAWDPRLQREVAVKVLPATAVSDPDRLRRFEQEASAAGALNHPNVVAVYDVGSHEGSPYIVSERLEGHTLRARLVAGAITPRKAVEHAIQIARGLAAAHQHGIVHRDLKPENVFVCADGVVKILDFGIAKLRRGETADTEDETGNVVTQPGMIVGTAAYMSPEQVRGLPVDARSDMFSLGVVLYEMLAGRRPFGGETAVEVHTAILREEPRPLSTLDRGVTAPLDRIVQRCLEKRPEDRFDTARDVALALEAASVTHGESAPAEAPPGKGRRLRAAAMLVAATVAGAGLGILLFDRLRPPAAPPSYTQLTFRRGAIGRAQFAPDGETVVYSAAWDGEPARVFTTRIGSRESRDLGIEGNVLAISSTGEMAVKLGRFYGFPRSGTLARVSLAGGSPRELAENVMQASWDSEGRDLAAIRGVEGLTVLEYPVGHALYRPNGVIHQLCVLPNRSVAIFECLAGGGTRPCVVSLVDERGQRNVLSRGWTEWSPLAWSSSTNEIFFAGYSGAEAALYAATMTGRTRVVGRVPGDFQLEDVDRRGRILLARSFPRGGVLVLPPGESQERDLSWLDFSSAVDLSQDGRQILVGDIGGGLGGRGGIGLRKTDGSPVVDLGEGSPLALSPDGRFVMASPVAVGTSDRLLIIPVGAGERREVQHPSLTGFLDAAWFPDGQRIVVVAGKNGSRARLYVWSAQNITAPRPISPEGEFSQPVVTPDGQWVTAALAGAPLALYPVDGGPPRALPGGTVDDQPLRWSTDGQWLFVRRGSDMPARIERLEVATGKRSLWKELRPAERAGVFGITSAVITPDGKSYAYTFSSSVGSLYLAEGLK